MATATLLLPPRVRLAGQPLPESVACMLGRADRASPDEAGVRAQLFRHFTLLPRSWPMAALTRQQDVGDATPSAWLRADPAYVRPDINGARLLAYGDALQLTQADADALLPPLRPLFGDAGFPIDAPTPSRWYLRLPREAKVPNFIEPADALGADLFEHLPEGPEGRRWRALLSEAQVVLHNHPHNAARIAAGKPPVNSLWFWGGGILPDHVTTAHALIQSDDATVLAMAAAAKVPIAGLASRYALTTVDAMIDLRAARDVLALADDWLAPAMDAVRGGDLGCLRLDCEDGSGFTLERRHRWRLWRKPLTRFDK